MLLTVRQFEEYQLRDLPAFLMGKNLGYLRAGHTAVLAKRTHNEGYALF